MCTHALWFQVTYLDSANRFHSGTWHYSPLTSLFCRLHVSGFASSPSASSYILVSFLTVISTNQNSSVRRKTTPLRERATRKCTLSKSHSIQVTSIFTHLGQKQQRQHTSDILRNFSRRLLLPLFLTSNLSSAPSSHLP